MFSCLPFAVVDVETTGLFPACADRVIEIAVVRLEPDGRICDRYATLLNPERDLGPTSVHGITGEQVLNAPHFREVVGDVTSRLRDAVVVGHNVRFDLGFIAAELERLGHAAPAPPALCTMALGARLGLARNGRSLEDLCAAVGVGNEHAHCATDDAEATAALLLRLLDRARHLGLSSLDDLGMHPGDASSWPRIAPSGLTHTRQKAVRDAASRSCYLSTLVSRLPAVSSASDRPDHAPYLHLVDRVLEDGVLTEQEAEGLVTSARDVYGLSRSDVRALHEQYLVGLAAAALEDSVVTDVERQEIRRAICLLGVPTTPDEALARAQEGDRAGLTHVRVLDSRSRGNDQLEGGVRVCFTGELCARFGGIPVSRETAESLANHAGLVVQRGVTKQLDILVVADPHSMSSKAKKARRYGTRIMTEQAFWRAIGVQVQ